MLARCTFYQFCVFKLPDFPERMVDVLELTAVRLPLASFCAACIICCHLISST